MTLLAKLIAATLLAFGFGATATVGVVGTLVHHTGRIGVTVEQADGPRINATVPALLADVALKLLPDQALEEAMGQARAEVGPYLPVLKEANRSLLDGPDFTLLEVQDGDETVRIEKRDRHIHVRVDGRDERIHVRFPVRTIHAATRLLEG